MTATIHGKTFEAKETNGKFFYYSKAARRWMPVKREFMNWNLVRSGFLKSKRDT